MLQLTVPLWFLEGQSVDGGEGIRLVTYNVGDGDLSEIYSQLAAVDADIIGLQEIETSSLRGVQLNALNYLAEQLGMFLHIPQEYEYTSFGLGILSKWPASGVEFVRLPDISIATPRSAIRAVLNTPFGDLQIITTHWNTPNFYTTRIQQLQHLKSLYNMEQQTILLGDLNTVNSILDLTYLLLMNGFDDAWVLSGNLPAEGKTYPSTFPVLRVDYIWLSLDIKVIQDRAFLFGDKSTSDHLGLSATIQMP